MPDLAVKPCDLEEELLQVKKITEANHKLADLKKMAEASIKQGSVPFYGCSRCRYNRGGCINYRCHPKKFGDHFAKFPEMYEPGTNRLKLEELNKLKKKDLVGGVSNRLARVLNKIRAAS